MIIDKKSKNLFLASFIGPTLVLYAIFIFIPICECLYYCFTDWSGISKTSHFIGIGNFIKLFRDPLIQTCLYNDFFITFISAIILLAGGIVFAVVISVMQIRGAGIFASILFIPMVISSTTIVAIFILIFNPGWGPLGSLFKMLGLKPVAWLGDSRYVLWAIIILKTWQYLGFFVIIYMTCIKRIPAHFFEVAMIEGAGFFRITVQIIIPLILQSIKYLLLIYIIDSLNHSFIIIHLLTQGGPYNSSEVLGTYLYKTAFRYYQFGYATSIGVLKMVITLVFYFLVNRIFGNKHYEY